MMPIDEFLRDLFFGEEMRRTMSEACERALRRVLSEKAPEPPGLLTTREAAKFAGVTADTVRVWIHTGQLTPRRVGKRWRVERDEISRLLLSGPKMEKRKPTIDQRAAEIVARHRGGGGICR